MDTYVRWLRTLSWAERTLTDSATGGERSGGSIVSSTLASDVEVDGIDARNLLRLIKLFDVDRVTSIARTPSLLGSPNGDVDRATRQPFSYLWYAFRWIGRNGHWEACTERQPLADTRLGTAHKSLPHVASPDGQCAFCGELLRSSAVAVGQRRPRDFTLSIDQEVLDSIAEDDTLDDGALHVAMTFFSGLPDADGWRLQVLEKRR